MRVPHITDTTEKPVGGGPGPSPGRSELGILGTPGSGHRGQGDCHQSPSFCACQAAGQRFPTRAPQGLLKHATPGLLVRGTDLLPLRLSNKQVTTANTTADPCEPMKIRPTFFVRSAEIYIFGVPQNFGT